MKQESLFDDDEPRAEASEPPKRDSGVVTYDELMTVLRASIREAKQHR